MNEYEECCKCGDKDRLVEYNDKLYCRSCYAEILLASVPEDVYDYLLSSWADFTAYLRTG